MAGILIFSDKTNLALELLTAANSISSSNGDIKAVTINNDEQAQALSEAGANVYRINAAELILADVSAVAAALGQAAAELGSDIILLSSNRRGKELAGRLAQVIGAGCLTDVNSLEAADGKTTCNRNALGGATVANQYLKADKQVIAIAPKSFTPAAGGSGSINDLSVEVKPSAVKLLEVKTKAGDSVDIEAAEVLVAVGQGLNSKDDLAMVEELAKLLGGEVACSKPVATDKKWLSEDRVIGLSGKICKPQLAIILGISGQVQFTVGIRDAKTIVSINTDENATINSLSDYVLTTDLHEAVKAMNAALK
ncbi:MAG: electron transfer flavoprotein subunit alpha/FixB family protein [Syntrophomonadaceae bacterium]|jgi:electron transfer flavoprotein alpha subunit|nr:electron transfer flavoprotein subunit alpha/FixB family protein [Syntrophomonadaceae bacterium]